MDIEKYLAPLTNNERGILMWAAKAHYGWYPQRTTSVQAELTQYHSGKTIPEGQRDKAILGLVEKGYATITPKRGNYWFRSRNYWTAARGMGAPIHKVFVEKQRGKHPNVPWHKIVDITPTADVKGMLADYRAKQDAAEKAEADRMRQKVPTMQAERERRVLNLCKRLIAEYDGTGEPLVKKHDQYDWYEVADVVDDLSAAVKSLDRWTSERRRIEQA